MNLPTEFGPYRLMERISVGGMAEVYKAKEYGVDGFERTVAVKRILPHVAEDEEFIAMFKDEAKIAVQLGHGNIAQIYSLGSHDDSFYIALEYVSGRDLRSIFQRSQSHAQTMPIAQACFIIMKVCEGLDYAHNKKDKYGRELNIVHRDVSPPNVLVSFEGEVKIIDFGVAKAAGRASKTQAGILKGKFGYMSPEQVRGMPLDRRSDIFSVGVVLWEILTNQRLFQGDTDFATLEKVRAVEVPPPSGINTDIVPDLEAIVYRALAREPDERYQSAMELHDELQAFMFAQGMFYSRKDLAAWMRKQYAKEIEAEKEVASAQNEAEFAARGGTAATPPGARPPPVPGRRGPLPKPSARAGGGTPRSTNIGGGGVTASHRTVGDGPLSPPPPPRQKRATLVMSTAKANLSPTVSDEPPTRLTPSKPRPQPTASNAVAPPAKKGGGELDWDEDELETRLFEGGDGEPIAAVNRANELATARLGEPAAPLSDAARAAVTSPPPGATATAQPAAAPVVVPRRPAPATTVMQAAPAPHTTPPGPAMRELEDRPRRRSAGKMTAVAAAVATVLGLGVGAVAMLKQGDAAKQPVTGSVVAPAATGSLTLNVTPGDAMVIVDGQMLHGLSPFVASGLQPGMHRVAVSKGDAFLPFQHDVQIGPGPTVLPIRLELRDVTLEFDTQPPKARVTLVSAGHATQISKGGERYQLRREPGVTYEIEVSANGYVTNRVPLVFTGEAAQTMKVALLRDPNAPVAASHSDPGDDKRKHHTKKPTAAKTSTLRIGTGRGMKPAKVSVDGRYVGGTPIIGYKVEPGTHMVEFSWDDGRSERKTVTVADGEIQKVTVDR